MTTRAREALADCEHALADFAASANTPFQRPRWVARMTLLRTVSLVLWAVDRPRAAPDVQRRIDDAWARLKATKPEPRIFHDFIDDERFKVVHLYEIRSAVNITLRPGAVWWNARTGETGSEPSGPTTFDFVMREGYFTGRDPLDLAREAITFWRDYLDAIDASDP